MSQKPFLFQYFLVLLSLCGLVAPLSAQNFEVRNFGYAQNPTHSHNEKCAHGVLEAKLEQEMGYMGSKEAFEEWIFQKIESRRSSPQINSRTLNETIKIPVVVHVIHAGTEIGEGPNIPDSQILEQIRVLNEDFNRTNEDAVNTPDEFLPVAGSANIEFVLARQDEQGLPTTGIVRVEGPLSVYDPDDAVLIGQTSQWNPEEYLNIWVVPLVQPFIGYASFPISDLPGLNFPPTSAITDGVTVDYRFFGVGGNSISSTRGRTATHEVGHYLGLRHIWGDGGCGVDDFVADTPEQDNSNNNCSANASRFSCNSNDMIQNYMDYTPDACMNLFTLGQIERFHVVLEESPRRVTLVNNRATEDPVLVNFDLGITRVIEPSDFACGSLIQPEIVVLNAGEENLNSAVIDLSINGQLVESKNVTFSLDTGEESNVQFEDFDLPNLTNEVIFTIKSVNNRPDENPDNNEAVRNPVIQGDIDLPYTLDFDQFPADWTIDNPDESITWENDDLEIDGQLEPTMFIRHYDYEAPGELDYFISPKIDLNRYPNAQLVFDLAYAPYDQIGFDDRLIVAVSQDCGGSFDINNAVYNKSQTRLTTSEATLDPFIPENATQFRTELFNLAPYQELGEVRLAIITQNGYGNNLYIKNIRILPNEEFKYNLEIEELVSPTPILDGTQLEERVVIRNTGNLPVSAFLFSRSTNGSAEQTFVASGSTVRPNETFELSGSKTSRAGKNRMDYTIFDPNFDANGNNRNGFRRYIIEDQQRIQSPWRQNFNNSTTVGSWTSLNPEQDSDSWSIEGVSSGEGPNNVVVLNSIEQENSYWFGGPLFDLTKSSQASFFFDLSAGTVSESTTLQVLASEDGGVNYREVWSASGSDLSTVTVGESNPNSVDDFRRNYVNLTEFAGTGKDNVRLAFVVANASPEDSPIYLDNFELFLSANPNPVIPTEGRTFLYPNPASEVFNLAFNLSSLETVNIQVISSTGSIFQDINYPSTLNQTYTFSTELFRPGVYILRITSDSLSDIKRVIIN